MKPKSSAEHEEELIEQIAKFRHDPYGFVKFAYPWGEVNGPLEMFTGPQPWQCQKLEMFADIVRGVKLSDIELAYIMGDPPPEIGFGKGRDATASGKGIGKSALVSWLVGWGMSTFPDTKGVLTAGTEPQLRTKTWPEVLKWHNMSICSQWFKPTGTSMKSVDPEHSDTWRMDALPWNENRMEAFAGLHNIGKRLVVIFDEASQIADVIWDTTDGIFTDKDTEVLWAVFGNPTRGNGRFFDAFNTMRHRWGHTAIDSRTVPIADKAEIQQWIEDYGEDSDYVRMNVRGLFPSVSSMQFMAQTLVADARRRQVEAVLREPLVMGVDVARFGDDPAEIAFRKGRDARSIPWETYRGLDNIALAVRVAEAFDRYKADALFVDGTGTGSGVVDYLRHLNYPVIDINFGSKADRALQHKNATTFDNKRSEMWGYMRDWMAGGAIPDEDGIQTELCGIMYGYSDGRSGAALQLEKKKDMKKRKLPSPNKGDALALTFAYPVQLKADAMQAGGIYQAHLQRNPYHAKTEEDETN
jgi:hypothetical protein